MQFNVAQLLKEPTGGTRKYEIHESLDDLDPELIIQEPITGRIKLTKIPHGILLVGTLNTLLEVNCSRCLEPFDLPLTIKLEEQFRPYHDLQTGASLPQEEDADEATLINEKNEIDLREVVRQALLLSLPALPVCQSECQGLCPVCGQNFNEARCDCPQESIDPRWDALRALLDRSDEDAPTE